MYRMHNIAHLADMGDSVRSHQHSKGAAALAMTDGMMAMHNRSHSRKIGEFPLPKDRSRSPVRPARAADPLRKNVKGKAKKMEGQVAKAEEFRKAQHSEKPLLSEVMKGLNKGALTKTAKAHGEKPLEFAKEVVAHPEEHTEKTRKRAQFLVNLAGNK